MMLKTFDKLFNIRQAVALHYGITYLKKLAEDLVEKEGLFGASVILYLAFGMDRLADFNSILTSWNHRSKTVRDSIGGYYKYRKFRLENVYAEATVTNRSLDWIYEPDAKDKTAGGICPILKELVRILDGSPSKVRIYLADAMKMNSWIKHKSLDIVHVDPPYYDVHTYGEFSEFFWILLRNMLEPALDLLFPNESIKISWSPYEWRVPRQEEVIAPKGYEFLYEYRLSKVIDNINKILKDDGIFLIWFAHRKMDAWNTLINAIRKNGFIPTNIIPLASEHPTRSITRGGVAGFSRAMIIIARKKESEVIRQIDKYALIDNFEKYLKKAKIMPNEVIPEEEINVLKEAVNKLLRSS
jgi:adenine-specific DNA methylase